MALYIGENPIELYVAGSRNGLTAYLHVRYSYSDNHSDMGVNPINAKYIGIYCDHNDYSSDDYTDYQWTQIAFDRPKLHIAYATDGNGANFSNTYFKNASWIGFSLTENSSPSTNYLDYIWVQDYGTKIESIKVNNTTLTIDSNKAVNIDLTSYATLNNPTFTGTPKAPDIGAQTNSQVATKNYVDNTAGTIRTLKVNGTTITQTDKIANINLSNFLGTASTATLETQTNLANAAANATTIPNTTQVKDYVNEYGGAVDSITVNDDDELITVNTATKNVDIDLSAYPIAENLQTPTLVTTNNLANADTLGNHNANEYALKTWVTNNFTASNDSRLSDYREPLPHDHLIGDLYLNNNTTLQSVLNNKSDSNHVHSSLSNGTQTVSLPTNLGSNDTFCLISDLNEKITYGTNALTAGSSTLASGVFYFQYEE